MEYTGKLYGEGGIPLMLTASDVDALESMRFRLCAALGLPADSAPEKVAEAVEARRVVVPELTDDEIHARLIKLFPDVGEDAPEREWCFKDSRWAYNLAASRARAIPADRVLGDGMAAMAAIKRKCQNDDEDAIETLSLCGYGEQADLLEAAIRANQGANNAN